MLDLAAIGFWFTTALSVVCQFILVDHHAARAGLTEVVNAAGRASATLAAVDLLYTFFLTI